MKAQHVKGKPGWWSVDWLHWGKFIVSIKRHGQCPVMQILHVLLLNYLQNKTSFNVSARHIHFIKWH